MSSQIMFFENNIMDLTNTAASISVTDATATNTGSSFVDYLRNRKNTSAWGTTDSDDAALTELEFNFGGTWAIDSIFLVEHNFKSYTVQYWNGVAWTDFSTAINETTNAETTTYHEFTQVSTNKVKLIINGTIIADDDKIMNQIIISSKLGQLNSWPIIKNPKISTNKRINRMLSGKVKIVETIKTFSTQLEVKILSDSDDLELIENIYERKEGVLIWINANDDSQFSSLRLGYRKQDIYLVRPVDDYQPEFYKGLYKSGITFKMKLEEII